MSYKLISENLLNNQFLLYFEKKKIFLRIDILKQLFISLSLSLSLSLFVSGVNHMKQISEKKLSRNNLQFFN